ncbi:Hypothetical_protein [Hexamita inflata]|uniref:Hypothetical_protein n=1 Tax=Hexamita inflata TaxID=28002 RepID=A0AA86QNV4_9EUKA|nr:Hypothetical protein HINF_LOCUS45082 [Hexamita inflata]
MEFEIIYDIKTKYFALTKYILINVDAQYQKECCSNLIVPVDNQISIGCNISQVSAIVLLKAVVSKLVFVTDFVSLLDLFPKFQIKAQKILRKTLCYRLTSSCINKFLPSQISQVFNTIQWDNIHIIRGVRLVLQMMQIQRSSTLNLV